MQARDLDPLDVNGEEEKDWSRNVTRSKELGV
jgi:hypothetical protein